MKSWQEMQDWTAYFEKTAGRPARPTAVFALDKFMGEGVVGRALDIGCGSGNDTAEMLERGWKVLAFDCLQPSLEFVRQRFPDAGEQLETLCASFADVDFPPSDLVVASYALPFCEPASFDSVWQKIRTSLKPGGRFAGQLFGLNDTWVNEHNDMTFVSRERLDELFTGMQIEFFEEVDAPETTVLGRQKNNHIYHVVAKRPTR